MPQPTSEVPDALQSYVRDVHLDSVVLASGVSGTDLGVLVGIGMGVLGPLAALGMGRLGWELAGASGAVFGSAAVYAFGLLCIAVAIVWTRDPEVTVTLGTHRLRTSVDGSERDVAWADVTEVRATSRGCEVRMEQGGCVFLPHLRGGAGDTAVLADVISRRARAARSGRTEVPPELEALRRHAPQGLPEGRRPHRSAVMGHTRDPRGSRRGSLSWPA